MSAQGGLSAHDLEALAVLVAERVAQLLEATPTPAAPPALVDVGEAAAFLGVPPSWLAAQARAGRAPSVQLGRYRRYRLAELEPWATNDRPRTRR